MGACRPKWGPGYACPIQREQNLFESMQLENNFLLVVIFLVTGVWAGPVSEVSPVLPVAHDYDRSLVDSAACVVADSAGVLTPFYDKLEGLRRTGDGTVTVLHVGDSHVQAGFFTGRVRELFQRDFGDAGRGLIVPHKLAGMNEARDYSITTWYAHHSHRVTDRDAGAGWTGVSITFDVPYQELTVWSKSSFSCLTVLHAEGAPALREPAELELGSYCDIDNTPTATRIPLLRPTDSLTLRGVVKGAQSEDTFYGFSLESGRPGVLYHALGINGAAFEHMGRVAQGGAAVLAPDLIVVSLGTNNCFGANFEPGYFYNVVDGYIRALKSSYAGVPVLITTPMEACRRSMKANPNIAVAASVIRSAARDNEVACWDFYTAAGGVGAMARWHARGLANGDRVHLTAEGYVLQGDMLYDALVGGFNDHLAI